LVFFRNHRHVSLTLFIQEEFSKEKVIDRFFLQKAVRRVFNKPTSGLLSKSDSGCSDAPVKMTIRS
jgi:hypothetical protein